MHGGNTQCHHEKILNAVSKYLACVTFCYKNPVWILYCHRQAALMKTISQAAATSTSVWSQQPFWLAPAGAATRRSLNLLSKVRGMCSTRLEVIRIHKCNMVTFMFDLIILYAQNSCWWSRNTHCLRTLKIRPVICHYVIFLFTNYMGCIRV